jgi:hypothetical protein
MVYQDAFSRPVVAEDMSTNFFLHFGELYTGLWLQTGWTCTLWRVKIRCRSVILLCLCWVIEDAVAIWCRLERTYNRLIRRGLSTCS